MDKKNKLTKQQILEILVRTNEEVDQYPRHERFKHFNRIFEKWEKIVKSKLWQGMHG